MNLYPVMATGIRAYCSDLIVDPEETDTVYFMSVCGYQATVKGIIANFLENYGISIELEDGEYYLIRSSFGYKAQMKRLPSGMVHSVVYPALTLPKNEEEDKNRFFIFTRRTEEKRVLFFRHLDERVEIPLHPSWGNWLWRLFKNQDEWLTELRTSAGNYRGYHFRFHPKELQDLISDAFKNKIPDIIECMKWKGGDSDGKLHLA
ncbi:MAG: hypothetical protein JRL30_11085 [Deltaproteobacteria bacterium]|nr:hypothetical protein [Deltaproteobacteria bacterium]